MIFDILVLTIFACWFNYVCDRDSLTSSRERERSVTTHSRIGATGGIFGVAIGFFGTLRRFASAAAARWYTCFPFVFVLNLAAFAHMTASRYPYWWYLLPHVQIGAVIALFAGYVLVLRYMSRRPHGVLGVVLWSLSSVPYTFMMLWIYVMSSQAAYFGDPDLYGPEGEALEALRVIFLVFVAPLAVPILLVRLNRKTPEAPTFHDDILGSEGLDSAAESSLRMPTLTHPGLHLQETATMDPSLSNDLMQARTLSERGDLAAAMTILQPLLRANGESGPAEARAEILATMARCHADARLFAESVFLWRKAIEADGSSRWGADLAEAMRLRQAGIAAIEATRPPARGMHVGVAMLALGALLALSVLTAIPQEILEVLTGFDAGHMAFFLFGTGAILMVGGSVAIANYKTALSNVDERLKRLMESFTEARYPDCPTCRLKYRGTTMIPCTWCGHAPVRVEVRIPNAQATREHRVPQPAPAPVVAKPAAKAEDGPVEDAFSYTSARLARAGLHWDGPLMPCPDCRTQISFTAKACPQCGAVVDRAYLDRAVQRKMAIANSETAATPSSQPRAPKTTPRSAATAAADQQVNWWAIGLAISILFVVWGINGGGPFGVLGRLEGFSTPAGKGTASGPAQRLTSSAATPPSALPTQAPAMPVHVTPSPAAVSLSRADVEVIASIIAWYEYEEYQPLVDQSYELYDAASELAAVGGETHQLEAAVANISDTSDRQMAWLGAKCVDAKLLDHGIAQGNVWVRVWMKFVGSDGRALESTQSVVNSYGKWHIAP